MHLGFSMTGQNDFLHAKTSPTSSLTAIDPAAILRVNHPRIFQRLDEGGLGISTLPNWRMRFLPSFCLSKEACACGSRRRRHFAVTSLQRRDRLAGDDPAADGGLDQDL